MLFLTKKYSELRLVIDPKAATEVNGRRVTKGLYGSTSGITVEFHEGRFETKDEDLIETLKGHRLYGVAFYTDEAAADKPNTEGLREENEKHAAAEEAGAICPECGRKYKTSETLARHMKTHEDKA